MRKLLGITAVAMGISITPLAPFVGVGYGQNHFSEGDHVGPLGWPGMGDGNTGAGSTGGGGDIGSLVNGAVNSAFSSFFGGGELPVRDGETRARTLTTAIKTTALLVDALLQALTGGAPNNESTGGLIRQQAEYGQDGSVLYGQYSPALWMDTYKEDIVYLHGDWVEDETIRDHRRLTTAMDSMQLLKMRQDAFEGDLAHLDEVKDAIDGCAGRNCAIQAGADATVSMAKYQLQTQQLLMTVGTLLANQMGGEVNDMTQKRAQQRYVMTNGGRSPQLVEWSNPGLW